MRGMRLVLLAAVFRVLEAHLRSGETEDRLAAGAPAGAPEKPRKERHCDPLIDQHTKVAAAAGPGRAGGGHFAKVLRVIMHAQLHQLEFFQSLERRDHADFWGTVYINPRLGGELKGTWRNLAADYADFRALVPVVDCDIRPLTESNERDPGPKERGEDFSYLCVGPFLQRFAREGFTGDYEDRPWRELFKGRHKGEVVGALIHQADFWFHPAFGRGWPLEKAVWHMDNACPDHIDTKEWGWRGQFARGLQDRVQNMATTQFRTNSICFGSADLYYLSKEGFSNFGAIVNRTWRWNPLAAEQKRAGKPERIEYNSNEVAVPTTLKALASSGLQDVPICWKTKGIGLKQKLYGSDSADPACCWGNYEAIAAPADILTSPCGHKIDMTDPCAKKALLKSWAAD